MGSPAPASAATTLAVPQRAVMASSARVHGIDVLRGLSIIAVVIHHIILRIRLGRTPLGKLLPAGVVNDVSWNGYNGVIIFFAVSGFLITTTCYRRWGALRNVNVRQFYRMRFARIAPCLIALLAVLSVLHVLHVKWYTIDPQRASLPRALLAAVTFHVNWLEAHRGYLPANWDVLWSLSNEEMFYLFFPLVCILSRSRGVLIAILSAFAVVAPFAHTVRTQNEIWADCGYLSCMGVIAVGCLAAMVCDAFAFSARARRLMQVFGAALVVFVTLFRLQLVQLGLYKLGLDVPLLALGTALLLIAFAQGSNRPNRLTAPIRWFGRNSYEIYLTHIMVVFAVLPFALRWDPIGRWAPLTYAVVLVGSGLLGGLIARFFSEPMNRKLRAHRAASVRASLAPEINVAG
jgi:peptidoglycan/LPS O-acetylase OafA/YrhL